jgi:hypothetical protein
MVGQKVAGIAGQCHLAKACSCTVKPVAESDKTSFSAVCNGTCAEYIPKTCEPAEIAKMTATAPGQTPTCVVNSPLGSMLFGQLSACEIDPASSSVTVHVFDGDDSVTKSRPARGRVEFAGRPCPGGNCDVGLRHRIHIDDMTFSGGLFGGDHELTELSGVGASLSNAPLDNTGAGTFGPGSTKHSVRGRDDDETLGIFKTADQPVAVALGGWQSGALCTLDGKLFGGQHSELFANLKGRLVNQPPDADAGPEQTGAAGAEPAVECSANVRGIVRLNGVARDPDNNVASIGWFRGSRTGPLVATLPTAEVEQAVSTPTSNNTTSYVLKVIDAFGQYDEDTTTVNVVDTKPPSITAPSDREAECTGPSGQIVEIGTATASDVCDDSPTIVSDAPQTFTLGLTPVTWKATDDSQNFAEATQRVVIKDTQPPTLSVQLSPTVLWPPDHKLVKITATIAVSDVCDPKPTVRLVSITSNEPDNGLGDGDQPEDIQGAGAGDVREFFLRAERRGGGGGRVYTIVYEASDHGYPKANTVRRTLTVTVPKSQ